MGLEDDYLRDVDGAPLLTFPITPLLHLHDYWHAIIFREDMHLSVDPAFHDIHSRLYLYDGTAEVGMLPGAFAITWESLPPEYSVDGTSRPTTAEEVRDLDGTFVNMCGDVNLCSSIKNFDISKRAVHWADCVDTAPLVGCRNAGTNYSAYRATEAVLGGTATLTVDLNRTGPYDVQSIIFGFSGATSLVFGTGQILLAADTDPTSPLTGGELFGMLATPPNAEGKVVHELHIPNNTALCGWTVYTQAVVGAGGPIALTNAQDLVITGAGCP